MKIRMLAIAFERGRTGLRSAQAWGLVSRTMTRRDGGSAVFVSKNIDMMYKELTSVDGIVMP